MSDFGTQHARQEAETLKERERTFSLRFLLVTVLLIILFLGFFLYPLIKQNMATADRFSQIVELAKLEQAFDSYAREYGQPPSVSPLATSERHMQSSESSLDSGQFAGDLKNLDEHEMVYFWLGGKAWQSNSPFAGNVVFDFSEDRLTDVDNDGWLEYRDRQGNFFVFRNGRIFLYDPSTELYMSSEDLEDQ